MSEQVLIVFVAILATMLILYLISRYVRSHPLSRKQEETLEEIAKDD